MRVNNKFAEDRILIEGLTETQSRYVEAVREHGSARAAAKALGVHYSGVSRALIRAARKGPVPGNDLPTKVLPGYVLGKVTEYRDGDGNLKGYWPRQEPEAQRLETFMQVLEQRFSKDAVKPAPLIKAPKHTDADLLAVYPLGDPHFGLYSWADETGENFDLNMADTLTRKAIDQLVSAAPPASEALLINLGDAFHADDSTGMTPASKNILDMDSRYEKVMMVGVDAMIHCTYRLLEKHEKVTVWNIKGNHDPHAHFALALAMWQHFRNNPRVNINTKPADYLYYRFGECLIGSHHGHGAKAGELPILMADDRKRDWGETTHRVWYCGHIHHKSAKEYTGCTVETFRTLAAKDAWHAQKGYRSRRDANVIVHHRQHGEVQRTRVDIGMIS